MDARMRRYAPQCSPERTKVWTEPSPKHQLQQQQQVGRRVAVVYYLCRNRHLEHPHFIEVPLSSPDGLYLRDVIDRLNVLRGKRMAAMYSWSCKRSYKSGFVWHDLSEDDLILPAQGNEYVLKGSEILDETPPDRNGHGVSNARIQNKKQPLQEPSTCYKGQEAACLPSSAVVVIKDAKLPPPLLTQSPPPPAAQEDDLSPSTHRSGSSGDVSSEPGGRTDPMSVTGSPKPAGYRIGKPLGAQNISTQTEDGRRRNHGSITRVMGVSTDDNTPEIQYNGSQNEQTMCTKDPEIVKVESSPTTTSTASSCGKMNTLESLIREEVSKRNNYRNMEAGEVFLPTGLKLKPTDMLINLITCGSISVKDHYGFGSVPNYTPRLTDMKLTSPMHADSMVLGQISSLAENQRQMGLRQRKKEYFSGSMIETNKYKGVGEGIPNLKRSSSFHEDRSYNMPYLRRDKVKMEDSDARNSFAGLDIRKCSPPDPSNGRRIIDGSSVEGSSMRLESFRRVKEKVIKIEESLLRELGL
ncbi:hypothetical protein Cni_G14132 [Canna indica]|uniref:SOSEKI DIX-like domain-containing protein n=1 Tax=Canna indica TaxID=4628 RepID=A0AAQ3KCD9_9LILI|nr:hypothetical protein Cni_G14132 [Canna indica]